METVNQCPHYQRHCKIYPIKVTLKLLAVRSFIPASCVTTRNSSLRKAVKCRGWNLRRSWKLNVLRAILFRSLLKLAASVLLNLGSTSAWSVVCTKTILKKLTIFFIVYFEYNLGFLQDVQKGNSLNGYSLFQMWILYSK